MTEETVSSEYLFRGRAINLRLDKVCTPDGRETAREVVEHDDCVAIIARDDKDNILLVRQFRYAVAKYLLEIPAGGIDAGEDAQAAVRREMQEETGYLPERVERIGGFYSSPGFASEYLHLYLATGLTPSRLVAEDTAGIELTRVPVSGVRELIASGEIEDAKSIAGLAAYVSLRDNQIP